MSKIPSDCARFFRPHNSFSSFNPPQWPTRDVTACSIKWVQNTLTRWWPWYQESRFHLSEQLNIWLRRILQHPTPWTHHTIAEIRIDKWMTPSSRLIILYLNNTIGKFSRIISHMNQHGKPIFPLFSSSWCPHFIVHLCNYIMCLKRSSKELIIHLPIFVVKVQQNEINLKIICLFSAID